MARIRCIKPEFPQSESIGRLSRDARLLFVELWTIADDAGRARAASRMLASLLFPYDNDAPGLIDGWLRELEAEGCVVRYEVEGSTYLQVANWLKHQKIDKPSASRLPQFDEASRKVAKPREPSAPDLGPRTLDQEKKEDPPYAPPQRRRAVAQPTDGSVGDAEAAAFQQRPGTTTAAKRGTRLPADWQPDPAGAAYAAEHGVDPALAAEEFRNYWLARSGRDATKLDWAATFRNRVLELAERGRFPLRVGAPRVPTEANPTGRPTTFLSGSL